MALKLIKSGHFNHLHEYNTVIQLINTVRIQHKIQANRCELYSLAVRYSRALPITADHKAAQNRVTNVTSVIHQI
jgi:hypothetical protein